MLVDEASQRTLTAKRFRAGCWWVLGSCYTLGLVWRRGLNSRKPIGVSSSGRRIILG